MKPTSRFSLSKSPVILLTVVVCLAAAFPLFARSGDKALPKHAVKAKAKVPAVLEAQALQPGRRTPGGPQENEGMNPRLALPQGDGDPELRPRSVPTERELKRAQSWDGDVRSLPQTPPRRSVDERVELEGPDPAPRFAPGTTAPLDSQAQGAVGITPVPLAPAPAPIMNFDGLDRFNWGAGSPPDTNGDVGPTHYIQSVNTSVGIFRKSDGGLEAAFTFDTLMAQGNFGNQCDTENFGDPVVLYDTFEDRWILTDFAFTRDGAGNVNPPIAFECFAVSKTGDPVSGGWNFYSIAVTDALNDYPKLGVWTDGIYMSANLFGFPAGSGFTGVRVWALNKAQMYAGDSTVQVVSFDVAGDFTLLPSNARLQVGTPPPGRPNLFVSSWNFLNALTVYKFHVDWTSIANSTFTGPDAPLASTSWPNSTVANAAQPGTAMLLDVLQIRGMVQNQYTNFGGTESLWMSHTVRRALGGLAAPRWYQVNVTGGTVAANLPQAATWDPDAANVINRFMPSVALDRDGNLAMGYSTSSGTDFPSIKYAGRLAADPVNTFSQTEQALFTGTASQTGTSRWGDYSAMTLDPDGCTFWYTNQYANPVNQAFNYRWLTRIGSFKYPSCTPVGAGGTVSGTITTSPGGAPIAGATMQLGSRSTTTDGSGQYSFLNIPAGTYPSISASLAGYVTQTTASIVVTDGNTTTQNFALASAPLVACLTDTSQADFLTGLGTNVDLTTSPGNVLLQNLPSLDAAHTGGTTTGTSVSTTSLGGQTFIPVLSGALQKVEVQLFCNGCTGTTPNITASIRATSAGLPTGPDLATATIPGFASGASGFYTATFGSPAPVSAGTQYALILKPTANPSPGSGYFWIRSSPGTYVNGQRVVSADGGTVWTADSTRDFNFKTYVATGYSASGTFTSSTKDANPMAGANPTWGTFSWTAVTPANTDVKFQAAASNNPGGPFTFVGPDTTAGTFFTSGGSLAQFNGNRYLKYRAALSTTDSAATPTVQDVTVCFQNVPATTSLAVASASGSFGGTANLSATLTSSSVGVAGKTVSFTLNGNPVGSGVTNGAGVASVLGASLVGITAGSYPGGVAASFAGDNGYAASSDSNTLTVSATGASISVNPSSVSEGITGVKAANISITRSGGTGAVTFNWSIAGGGAADGTATLADSDYVPSSGTFLFPAGGSNTRSFSMPGVIAGDNKVEPAETFTVSISRPDAGPIGTASNSVTITNDDATPAVSVSGVASVSEGTTPYSFTATLDRPSYLPITVDVSAAAGVVLPASTPGDFTSTTAQFTFAPGTTTAIATFDVGIVNDAVDEDNETFTVTLSSPVNAVLGTATKVGSIIDNDAPPVLTINDVSVAEGDTGTVLANFTVTLTGQTERSSSVTVDTLDQTATALSDDYEALAPFALNFGPGGPVQTHGVSVTVNADTLSEVNETFSVRLTAPVRASIGDSTGTGTIQNVPADPLPVVSISDAPAVTETEGPGVTAVFDVTLSTASGQTVTIKATTVAGTATATDVVYKSSTLTFLPGETSKQFSVQIYGDTDSEPVENFTVVLSGGNGKSTIGDGSGLGTINDNDPPPPVSVRNLPAAGRDSGSVYAFTAGRLGGGQPGRAGFPIPVLTTR